MQRPKSPPGSDPEDWGIPVEVDGVEENPDNDLPLSPEEWQVQIRELQAECDEIEEQIEDAKAVVKRFRSELKEKARELRNAIHGSTQLNMFAGKAGERIADATAAGAVSLADVEGLGRDRNADAAELAGEKLHPKKKRRKDRTGEELS